ncbi:MAG: M20/M25/M40 family metallo-hydrolase [Phycisphaerales bacterium]|nr:M20/M25/M40 family metallo-hydrolase [Phycisphaerales bacterium]
MMTTTKAGGFLGVLAVLWTLGGCSVSGPRVAVAPERSLPDRLREDVRVLSEGFAARNANSRATLDGAGRWIAGRLESMGYAVEIEYEDPQRLERGFNVVAELAGDVHPDQIVLIGAHYDAEVDTPGADDNASGVAVMLELARRFAKQPQARTIRWVAFTNEENSNSRGGQMGSFAHATNARLRGDQITAMVSLEMLGYYNDAPDSQRYPFDPSLGAQLGMELSTTGDFIGVVGRTGDAPLIQQIAGAMSSVGTIPVVGAPLPAVLPAIWRSDHGSFWIAGYPGVMVTDTSEYRNANYHRPSDLIGTLDFDRMAGVADAMEAAVRAMSSGQ